MSPLTLFAPPDRAVRLVGDARRLAEATMRASHYTHSVPSGKSYWFQFDSALIVFSIPANRFSARVVLGRDGKVWELTRLWAPDGHEKNLLTRAISAAVREFERMEDVEALVSYADPNAGHRGGVYRAASWSYQGQSSENRVYVDASGQTFARRKFHSGNRHMNKPEIEAKGFRQLKLPGKHRFAHGLNKWTRREVAARCLPAPIPARRDLTASRRRKGVAHA